MGCGWAGATQSRALGPPSMQTVLLALLLQAPPGSCPLQASWGADRRPMFAYPPILGNSWASCLVLLRTLLMLRVAFEILQLSRDPAKEGMPLSSSYKPSPVYPKGSPGLPHTWIGRPRKNPSFLTHGKCLGTCYCSRFLPKIVTLPLDR